MSSFDFSAILKLLSSLFEAFMNLFAKLGFDLNAGTGDNEGADTEDKA